MRFVMVDGLKPLRFIARILKQCAVTDAYNKSQITPSENNVLKQACLFVYTEQVVLW